MLFLFEHRLRCPALGDQWGTRPLRYTEETLTKGDAGKGVAWMKTSASCTVLICASAHGVWSVESKGMLVYRGGKPHTVFSVQLAGTLSRGMRVCERPEHDAPEIWSSFDCPRACLCGQAGPNAGLSFGDYGTSLPGDTARPTELDQEKRRARQALSVCQRRLQPWLLLRAPTTFATQRWFVLVYDKRPKTTPNSTGMPAHRLDSGNRTRIVGVQVATATYQLSSY